MASSVPKDPSVRQRRNAPKSGAARLQPVHINDVMPVPVMPPIIKLETNARGGIEEVLVPYEPNAVLWWQRVWRSPMCSQYEDADIAGLERLLMLENNFWKHPNAQTHSEIRLAQKDYGLTPMDRRRLEWQIESTEDAQAKGTRRRNTERPERVVEPAYDPRRHTA